MLAERWQRNLAVLFIGQLMMLVAFSFFFPSYRSTSKPRRRG